MLLVVTCLLLLLSPLVAGRWSAALLTRRWRWPLAIWLVLALQVVVVEVELPDVLAAVLHVGTYAAAVAFLVLNRRVPGVLVVGAGALANGVTIALNDGVLPATAAAVRAAGLDPTAAFVNSGVVAHPVLPWLGDVFAWPAPLPLANTFSIGDVLIAVGVGVAAWTGTRRLGQPAIEEPRGAQHPVTER
jgi:hypothetical protein